MFLRGTTNNTRDTKTNTAVTRVLLGNRRLRPLPHERLDLWDIARRLGDPLQSAVGQEIRILDAHADLVVALHHWPHAGNERPVLGRVRQEVEQASADVDAWLDHERIAGLIGASPK